MKSPNKTLEKIIKQLQELEESIEGQQAKEYYAELIPEVIASLEELKSVVENDENEEGEEDEND